MTVTKLEKLAHELANLDFNGMSRDQIKWLPVGAQDR